ncbi:MAG: YidC/Oxa1 family membrane protein insertase [Candidatus Pacebacteria bacterium]|jgi:YidC/Oxa1 family membrane protein insertase|nr:YidC/Oxa1 family membrane protein insertase [Candidatus Paceibacterota bacterium]
MITTLWNNIFYEPLYNALAFLVSLIPGGDIGVAVILLTILVRFILYPIAKKSIESQIHLRNLQPEIDAIKEKYTDKLEQSRRTFELYKQYKVNPFSGCLLVLLQLPVIFALYKVFLGALSLDAGLLYQGVSFPPVINTQFLGFLDMSGKSIVLAILAAVTQFIQARLTLPKQKQQTNDGSFQKQFAKSMQMQMQYVLPIFVGIISYQVAGAVALYWATSNIFTIFQEIIIRRRLAKKTEGNTVSVQAKVIE